MEGGSACGGEVAVRRIPGETGRPQARVAKAAREPHVAVQTGMRAGSC